MNASRVEDKSEWRNWCVVGKVIGKNNIWLNIKLLKYKTLWFNFNFY